MCESLTVQTDVAFFFAESVLGNALVRAEIFLLQISDFQFHFDFVRVDLFAYLVLVCRQQDSLVVPYPGSERLRRRLDAAFQGDFRFLGRSYKLTAHPDLRPNCSQCVHTRETMIEKKSSKRSAVSEQQRVRSSVFVDKTAAGEGS